MGRKDEEVKKTIREMEEWELVEVTEKVAGLGINGELLCLVCCIVANSAYCRCKRQG